MIPTSRNPSVSPGSSRAKGYLPRCTSGTVGRTIGRTGAKWWTCTYDRELARLCPPSPDRELGGPRSPPPGPREGRRPPRGPREHGLPPGHLRPVPPQPAIPARLGRAHRLYGTAGDPQAQHRRRLEGRLSGGHQGGADLGVRPIWWARTGLPPEDDDPAGVHP